MTLGRILYLGVSSGVQVSSTSKTHRDMAHIEPSATCSLAIERNERCTLGVALFHLFSSDTQQG